MKINYSKNHKHYDLPIFKDLKGHLRFAVADVLNIIVHMTHSKTKSCKLYVRQFAADLGVKHSYIKEAVELLVSKDYIKCVKAYERQTMEPAVYASSNSYYEDMQGLGHPVDQARARGRSRLGPRVAQAGPPSDKGKNIQKEYYKQKKNDSIEESSSFLKEKEKDHTNPIKLTINQTNFFEQ